MNTTGVENNEQPNCKYSHFKLDDENEEAALNELLEVEQALRNCHELIVSEHVTQNKLMDRIWKLSQRHIMIVTTGKCCRFPEIYQIPTDALILHEYYEKFVLLRKSNSAMLAALDSCRLRCRAFETACAKLDYSAATSLILGDVYHKPISYFIEFVSDAFKYMHASVLKLKYFLELLDPIDALTLDEYRSLLNISDEFNEYMRIGLTYCKCLRKEQLNCKCVV